VQPSAFLGRTETVYTLPVCRPARSCAFGDVQRNATRCKRKEPPAPTTQNAHSRQAKQIAWGGVGARQKADLAELADWVEGLRAAAHAARQEGNITLAEALDITRFEVYEGYLDEELEYQQSQATARRSR
jgi:hypothetical protein